MSGTGWLDTLPLWGVFGATLLLVLLSVEGGYRLGRYRHKVSSREKEEPVGAMVGATLGLLAFLLAFTFGLAATRFDARRDAVLAEANAIGTTYLRAETLPEPTRSRSLGLLIRYTRSAIRISDEVPGSDEAADARDREQHIQRRLWRLAGDALEMAPVASAPRLYVETLNEMFDGETTRVAALSNRVPTAVLVLEILGSALALSLLAAYLAIVGRGVFAVLLASALVAFLLLVTADLDRPTRGMIQVPDTVLTNQLESMTAPPAAAALRSPSR
jgi:hypothetical protein